MRFAVVLWLLLHNHSAAVRAQTLAPLYNFEALKHGVSPSILTAVCGHESGHRYWITYRGAYGLCQVRPNALPRRTFTVDELMRIDTNVDIAATHLARDLRLCHGNVEASVARYQRGHGCETSGYARRVLRS